MSQTSRPPTILVPPRSPNPASPLSRFLYPCITLSSSLRFLAEIPRGMGKMDQRTRQGSRMRLSWERLVGGVRARLGRTARRSRQVCPLLALFLSMRHLFFITSVKHDKTLFLFTFFNNYYFFQIFKFYFLKKIILIFFHLGPLVNIFVNIIYFLKN